MPVAGARVEAKPAKRRPRKQYPRSEALRQFDLIDVSMCLHRHVELFWIPKFKGRFDGKMISIEATARLDQLLQRLAETASLCQIHY